MAYKTIYKPVHPEKYVGDVNNIICRSLWERRFAKYCDHTSSISKWASEEIVIPYVSPADGRVHRYYCDFWMEVRTTTGVRKFLVEIKPHAQTQPPVKKSRRTQRFLKEATTFAVNQAKWAACSKYCKERGWTFLVLTEHHLFGRK